MKNKAVKMAKAVGIGFIVLFVLLMLLANVGGDSEPQETVTEQQSMGTFTIDGDDSLFEGYTDQGVEIWSSDVENDLTDDISKRTLVAKLSRGTEVELLQRGTSDWYCQVRYGNDVGWLACDWLK